MQKPLNVFLTNGKERKYMDQKWHRNVKQLKSFKFGMFPQSCIIAQHCAKQCKKLEETTIGWDALWKDILILMKNYIWNIYIVCFTRKEHKHKKWGAKFHKHCIQYFLKLFFIAVIFYDMDINCRNITRPRYMWLEKYKNVPWKMMWAHYPTSWVEL